MPVRLFSWSQHSKSFSSRWCYPDHSNSFNDRDRHFSGTKMKWTEQTCLRCLRWGVWGKGLLAATPCHHSASTAQTGCKFAVKLLLCITLGACCCGVFKDSWGAKHLAPVWRWSLAQAELQQCLGNVIETLGIILLCCQGLQCKSTHRHVCLYVHIQALLFREEREAESEHLLKLPVVGQFASNALAEL